MFNEVSIDVSVSPTRAEALVWNSNTETESTVEPPSSAVESSEPVETGPAPAAFQAGNYQSLLVKRDLMSAYESRSIQSVKDDSTAEEFLPQPTSAGAFARMRATGVRTNLLSTEVADSDPMELSEPPVVEDDFSQLGVAFRTSRAPQILWNDEAVNTVSANGLREGSLTAEQAERNTQLASEVFKPQLESEVATPLQFSAGDLALIVQGSGLSFSRQDPNQLKTAASYVNDSNDAAEQEERLRKTLDVFHTLDRSGAPQLTRDQMIGELWVAARVPKHAIEKMNNAELARTYQDVAAVVNGPAGQHKLKVGKHEVTLTVNDANEVVNSNTKKPSVWGKVGKIALTVASFVPGPVGIAARIASSVISAAEGIKNKSWMQAVIGGASGIAAGASAIAGRAIAGAAVTTARVADSIAKGARAWQAGLQAVHAKNPAGLFNAVAGVASSVVGAVGDSAETVANLARKVETWAGRAYVAAEVRNISRLGWKDQLLAVGGHGANLILDYGDLRPASSSFEVKWKLGVNVGQTVRAGLNLQRAIKSGDVLNMSEAASEFRAVSHNAYQNAALARAQLNNFNAQARSNQSNTASGPDLQYDGVWIGAGGTPATPAGPFTLPVLPALPSGDLVSDVPTVYVNGVLNTVAVQSSFMQKYSDRSGTGVLGIHNSTQGIVKDVFQSFKDKLDIGRNPAVDTLAAYVYGQLDAGVQVNLAGHSQGALIISRALTDVRNRLRLERQLSNKEVDSLLGNVTVTTMGGFSGHYPNGPQYFHFINRGDYVALSGGLTGDLLGVVPLLHAGRNARIVRFTDFSLPNAHDSNLYLNIYRRPNEFANGRNPYTPAEIKQYKIDVR